MKKSSSTIQRLWAPWRLDYVRSCVPHTRKARCLFCAKYRSTSDATDFVLARTRHAYALLNIFPYNNGHLMVAPRRHVAEPERLTSAEVRDVWMLVGRMKRALERVVRPHGFNIGINCGQVAGAGIADHLHVHVVPRWNGDTNFMPVIGNTKVIPQSLEALYALLTHALPRRNRTTRM